MSKLVDIIKRIVKQEIKAQNNEIHVPCIIESVSDDYLRADVSLLADPDVIIPNRLNKSGEKLTEGQQAWLYYTTLPSSGYIGRTEGEADPMGGGSGTTVENAAVMLDSTFHDYAVDNQMILNVEPQGRLYYGLFDPGSSWAGKSGMCIVQGHYCVLGHSSTAGTPVRYDSGTDTWTIFGSTDLYDAIIDNHEKFGRQIGNESNGLGGFLFASASGKTYPDKYQNLWVDISSVSGSPSGASINGSGYYSVYMTSGTSSANWWEGSVTHNTSPSSSSTFQLYYRSSTNTSTLAGHMHECFLVPVVIQWTDGNPSSGNLVSPFGYVRIGGYLLFTKDDSGWGVYATNISSSGGSGGLSMNPVPLISEAERCFFLGISQKTEPVYP